MRKVQNKILLNSDEFINKLENKMYIKFKNYINEQYTEEEAFRKVLFYVANRVMLYSDFDIDLGKDEIVKIDQLIYPEKYEED